MKKSTWCLLGAVALIFMLWMLRSVREGFTQPSIKCPAGQNSSGTPVITGAQLTQSDVDYILAAQQNGGATSGQDVNADELLSWIATNIPSVVGSTTELNFLLTLLLTYSQNSGETFPTTQGKLPFPTSATDQFIVNYAKALKVFDPYNPSGNPATTVEIQAGLADFLPGPSSGDMYMIEWVWSYFYGSCSAPPAKAAPSPLSGASSSSSSASFAPKTGPTPTPTPSNSTTVSVPSPCKAQLQSIPGGSMEFKCFNS